MSKVKIVGSKFTRSNVLGDFKWMISNPNFDNCLFIFNDNEEHHQTSVGGGGNAAIRPYNKHNKRISKPRSAGIPTGTLGSGGYRVLNDHVREVVDQAIQEIMELVQKYNYAEVYYSIADETDPTIGTGIFNVNEEVKQYITQKILNLGELTVSN